MANEVQAPPEEASAANLMRGIINDIGDLIRHEIRFARTEIRTDLRKTKQAATVLTLGVGTTVLGAFLFALMLVHLLHWGSQPAGPPTESGLPLWGCFGIVSAVFLGIGAIVACLGWQMFQQFNPLPDQTAQTIKENIGWTTNSK
jgi:predicted PurR-regulated permease PerM